MPGEARKRFVIGEAVLEENKTTDSFQEDTGTEQHFDIKEEPADSKRNSTDSVENAMDETLDSETNKNLSTFLDNLIASHGANEDGTETYTQNAQQLQKSTAKLGTSEWSQDKDESLEETSRSVAITFDQKAQVRFPQ